jgi:hypothetical protein
MQTRWEHGFKGTSMGTALEIHGNMIGNAHRNGNGNVDGNYNHYFKFTIQNQLHPHH